MKGNNQAADRSAIDAETAARILKSRSVEALTARITGQPAKAWEHASAGEGLAFTVSFGVEKTEERFVKSMLGSQPMLDLSGTLGGNLSILLTNDTSRTEHTGKGVLGSSYTVLRNKQQDSVLLDHATRTYLHLPADAHPKHKFQERFVSRTQIVADKNGKAQAVIQIDAPYRLRYEIDIDTDKRYRPFIKEAACSIIGCTDKFKEAGIDLNPLLEAGIPVAGRVYSAGAGGNLRLVSSFSVSDLQLVEIAADDFSIPKGYADLRQASAKADNKQPKPLGPTVRLSDIRRSPQGPAYDGILQPRPLAGRGAGAGPIVGTTFHTENFTTANFDFPTCFNETYGSLIADLVDEKLLDDLKYFGNAISKRLSGFTGTGGSLNIDWLNQMKTASDALGASDPGGGAYLMLHDERPLAPPSRPNKKGVLDLLAVSDLGDMLGRGDNLSSLNLPAALQASVDAVIANSAIQPSDRFSNLSPADQGDLVDWYVFHRIGTIALQYPSSTPATKIFYDLLYVKLDNIEFDVAINNSAIFSTLDFDNDSVHMVVNLPDASGKAFMSRWPSEVYAAAVGISAVACIFFPPACTLTATLIAVGLFIGLDFAFVSLDLSNLTVDAHARLTPNGAGVLQPTVQLTLDANVSAFYMSVIPDGIHQILSAIYMVIVDHTNLVITQLQGQLQDKLNSFLQHDLGITYPPAFGPVPLLGISSDTEFVLDDHGFVEQSLNAGTTGIIAPYITQVDGEVKSKILLLRDRFKNAFTDPVAAYTAAGGAIGWAGADLSQVARYYLGTVLSQNFINHFVYTLWRRGTFNYDFTATEASQLFDLLRVFSPAFQNVTFAHSGMTAHFWSAVPPRTVFTPKPASEGQLYATTFFDDVRLCIEFRNPHSDNAQEKVEFLFAAQADTEVGFGGFNSSTNKLDLLKTSDRLFDIYFDLRALDVRVIHPEIQSFVVPGMQVRVDQDYSALNHAELQQMFALACQLALKNRDRNFIPRSPGDPLYLQRYPLGTSALQMIFQLVPFQGNLYVSQGMSGAATGLYQGALDIDAMDKILAGIIRELVP